MEILAPIVIAWCIQVKFWFLLLLHKQHGQYIMNIFLITLGTVKITFFKACIAENVIRDVGFVFYSFLKSTLFSL